MNVPSDNAAKCVTPRSIPTSSEERGTFSASTSQAKMTDQCSASRLMKTCPIKREAEHWSVIFACEVEAEKVPLSSEDVGIDLGVTHFAALSDGTFIGNPRHYRQAEKKFQRLQQALARKKCGSHRRQKAVKQVARAHRKVRNQRKEFLHKESRKLVNRYQV